MEVQTAEACLRWLSSVRTRAHPHSCLLVASSACPPPRLSCNAPFVPSSTTYSSVVALTVYSRALVSGNEKGLLPSREDSGRLARPRHSHQVLDHRTCEDRREQRTRSRTRSSDRRANRACAICVAAVLAVARGRPTLLPQRLGRPARPQARPARLQQLRSVRLWLASTSQREGGAAADGREGE